MVEPVYLAVSLIGLVHGLEPSHGWPIAILYALRRSKPLKSGFIASSIISSFHIFSSIAVVAAYVIFTSFLTFSIPYIRYIAGAALLALAARFWFEKPNDKLEDQHDHIHEDFDEKEHVHMHEHSDNFKHTHKHKHRGRILLTLKGIAIFALILGFAHEEEFALLALVVGGVDPLLLMLAYASAVSVGIVGITLIGIKTSNRLRHKVKRYEKFLPKISATILTILAISFIFGIR